MRKLLLGLFSLGVCAGILCAGDTTNLRIAVTNPAGKPVDNASVVVKFVSGRSKAKFGAKIRTEWNMRTSQEGIAKMPSIPKGTILIQIRADHYQTFGQNFDVQEDDRTVEIKLQPPQAQYTAH